jgi:hypothetical protein
MYIRTILSSAFAAIVGLSSPAGATDVQIFLPNSQWTANSDDGRCTLARNFANAVSSIELAIEPLPLSKDADLVLKGAGLAGPDTRFSAQVGFSSDGQFIGRDATAFDTADKTRQVMRLRLILTDLDKAAASGNLTIMAKGRLHATFSVPKLAAGLRALAQCEQAIIENVGLSSVQIAEIVHNAEPPMRLFRWSDEYYKVAEKSDLEDESIARYIIGPDGKPISCSIIHRARDVWLNNGSCSYMSEPQSFTPAKDQNGRPVVGLYFERTRWHRKSTYVPPTRY